MTSNAIYSLGALAFITSAALAPSTIGLPGCNPNGCTGSENVYTHVSSITITETVPLDMVSGTCFPNCTTNKCRLNGELTVDNGTTPGAGLDIYIRGRLNGTCVPGVEVVGGGASSNPFEFDDEVTECGTTFSVYVYLSPPGANCGPYQSKAGFTATCSGCESVPH